MDQLAYTPALQTLDSAGKACQLKHSSLLRTLVNYVRKKFYNIGSRGHRRQSVHPRGVRVRHHQGQQDLGLGGQRSGASYIKPFFLRRHKRSGLNTV